MVPPIIDPYTFYGDPFQMPDRTYYVPSAVLLDYKAADVWKTFEDDIVAN